jgi:cellulose synthase/poly-beta-1,6-N-acetylglucosamine synthase-like glycosyltransferase
LQSIYYILGIATFIQVVYLLLVYSRILFYREKTSEPSLAGEARPVSVLVCAHNERSNLERLLPLLLSQEYSDYEVLVVDDRSEDGSFDYFREKYHRHPRFSILQAEPTHAGQNFKKSALTQAIHAARYEYLLLTDADCIPASSRWVETMMQAAVGQKKLVLGYSPYEYRRGWLNLLIRFDTLHTAVQYFSFALSRFPYMGVGRNLLYQKSLFLKNDGFASHSTTTGGDDDLFVKEVATAQNTAVCFRSEAHVYSLPKENYRSWLRQKRRHLSVGHRYKIGHKLLLGLEMVSRLLFYTCLIVVLAANWKAGLLYLMIRGLVFVVIFALIARKLRDNYRWYWLLPFDILYILNYLVITLSLVIDKRIKWS